LHILQVISHYVPAYRYGGPLRVAHGLSRALVEAGHEVTVCCTNLADETTDLDVPLDKPVDVDGATVYYEPTRISRYWGYSPKLKSRLKKEVPKADVVLVHAHYQYANYVGARTARLAGVPYVVFTHNSLHYRGIRFQGELKKRIYLRLFEERNLEGALFLAFNGREELEGSLHKERGLVVPNGIDPCDFLERPPHGSLLARYPSLAGKVILLFLGRLDFRQKGLDLLVRAFATLIQDHPQLHLFIAGPDEKGGHKQVTELATELEIESEVTLAGMLTGPSKIAALQGADAFVLVSKFEGVSIALLEALYFGLPVLVSDRVGLAAEIERCNAGIVVKPDLSEIREGLLKLATESVRKRFLHNGTVLVNTKYLWRSVAEELTASISAELESNAS